MQTTILLAILLSLTIPSLTTAKRRSPPFKSVKLNDLNKDFHNNPTAKAHLLASATRADGKPNPYRRKLEEYDDINSHIAKYSIQFQGCHHIQQWNDDENDEDDIRVLTKRLVRFRLIPYETCEAVPAWAGYVEALKNRIGKFDDFGEYIVDLNEFVYSYLVALSEGKGSGAGSNCEEYEEICNDSCGEDAENDEDCLTDCYGFYGCNADDDQGEDQEEDEEDIPDPLDYAMCAELEGYEQEEDDNYDDGEEDEEKKYYYGPYCANHGAEIKMSLFSDDTCTTTAKCNKGNSRGSSCYYQVTGTYLPYSQENIVQDPCITCSNNYIALDRLEQQRAASEEQGDKKEFKVEYEYGYPRDVCSNIYSVSGKCETHMSEGQQYENACEYIKGIRIAVDNDGVAMGVKRSRKADYVLAGLAGATVIFGLYVHYLSYKLHST